MIPITTRKSEAADDDLHPSLTGWQPGDGSVPLASRPSAETSKTGTVTEHIEQKLIFLFLCKLPLLLIFFEPSRNNNSTAPTFFFFCVDDINGKPCVFYFIFLTHISQKGQHALWKYIGGGNSHAPLRYDIDRILDSGCGLGEWTMEMAKEFPNATVYGIDINPELFPSVHQAVPSNCLFSPSNLLTRLSFPDQYFDFVYQRFLYLGLTVEDWPVALKELRRVMKPGGWIELFEPCMRVHRAGTRTREVMRWCSRLLQEERGLDFDFAGEKMKRLCESPEIGFHNVKLERLSIPVGAWGGRVGQAMAENMVLIFQTLQSALVPAEMTPSLDGSSMKAFDLMVQSWIRECEENKSYIDYYILVGQKPFEKEA
ncbi:S-adenosyl-L-methionine-dependent methyltransferase [Linnemannia elongata]|nr:S-adenosyl-L-methionine-dependent methyltransferase [Linnemannia elongata]